MATSTLSAKQSRRLARLQDLELDLPTKQIQAKGEAAVSQEPPAPNTPPQGGVTGHSRRPEVDTPVATELHVSLIASTRWRGTEVVLQPGQIVPVWSLSPGAWVQVAPVSLELVAAVLHDSRYIATKENESRSAAELDLLAEMGSNPSCVAGDAKAAFAAELGNVGGLYRYELPEKPVGMLCAGGQLNQAGTPQFRSDPLSPVLAHKRFRQTEPADWADIRPMFFVEAEGGMQLFDLGSKKVVQVKPVPLPFSFEPIELLTGVDGGGDLLVRQMLAGVYRWSSRARCNPMVYFGLGFADPDDTVVTADQYWAGQGAWPRKAVLPLTDVQHGLRLLSPAVDRDVARWLDDGPDQPLIRFKPESITPPEEGFVS
jgi:hypothetical protein